MKLRATLRLFLVKSHSNWTACESLSSCRAHPKPHATLLKLAVKPHLWPPTVLWGEWGVVGKQEKELGAGEVITVSGSLSLCMAFGSTCWGFWLDSEREGRTMMSMTQERYWEAFSVAQLHQEQGIPPGKPHLRDDWGKRSGCWEHSGLLAICQLWHLLV